MSKKENQEIEPRVSIIIPNYCHSRYLDERLKSILQQTYQNFEIIILDDCSPDNGASRAIIEKYRNNPHVSHIIYNERNSGNTFKQWKKGIELAKGPVIWIAESDDFCEPNMLEELMIHYNQRKDTVIAYTSYSFADEMGSVVSQPCRHPLLSKLRQKLVEKRVFSGRDFNIKCQLLGNHIENASTAIFSKEAYNKITSDYLAYKSAGDYLFWIKMAELGSVVKLNKGLSYFRRHSNVVTFKSDSNGANFKANKEIIDYIISNYSLGPFRRSLARAHQIIRIEKERFDEDNVKLELLSMWGSKSSVSVLMRTIHTIYVFLSSSLEIYP